VYCIANNSTVHPLTAVRHSFGFSLPSSPQNTSCSFTHCLLVYLTRGCSHPEICLLKVLNNNKHEKPYTTLFKKRVCKIITLFFYWPRR
uniref:Uncharacterized protein n=1 Tax=Cynoglossus semilaevis TaxID=244447 RepID=A0A3P8V233_CYNSE